jgi:hypothetical protein
MNHFCSSQYGSLARIIVDGRYFDCEESTQSAPLSFPLGNMHRNGRHTDIGSDKIYAFKTIQNGQQLSCRPASNFGGARG